MAPEELIAATHRVLMGRKYITPTIAEKLTDEMNRDNLKLPHESLSDREFEVLKLLAAGNSLIEIGNFFSISATTVSTYRGRILTKMRLRTNADLTKYAIVHKLINEL